MVGPLALLGWLTTAATATGLGLHAITKGESTEKLGSGLADVGQKLGSGVAAGTLKPIVKQLFHKSEDNEKLVSDITKEMESNNFQNALNLIFSNMDKIDYVKFGSFLTVGFLANNVLGDINWKMRLPIVALIAGLSAAASSHFINPILNSETKSASATENFSLEKQAGINTLIKNSEHQANLYLKDNPPPKEVLQAMNTQEPEQPEIHHE